MRVMVKNPDGCCEIVLVEKATIASFGNALRLYCGNSVYIHVDVSTNFMAYSKINHLLENGYVDLSEFYADYKKLA